MATLVIKAEELKAGDLILLPMGRKVVVADVRPLAPQSRYIEYSVQSQHGFRTERVWRDSEVYIRAEIRGHILSRK